MRHSIKITDASYKLLVKAAKAEERTLQAVIERAIKLYAIPGRQT
jgi:hypothetical protein